MSDHVPAWRRPTMGEQRWPAALAILAVIGLQLVLPAKLTPYSLLLPGIGIGLLLVLAIADPGRVDPGVSTGCGSR